MAGRGSMSYLGTMSSEDIVHSPHAKSSFASHRTCRGNIACPLMLVLAVAALGGGSIAFGFGGDTLENFRESLKGIEAPRRLMPLKAAPPTAPPTAAPTTAVSPCDTPVTTPPPPPKSKCNILTEKVPQLIIQAFTTSGVGANVLSGGSLSCSNFNKLWNTAPTSTLTTAATPKVQVTGALFKVLSQATIRESLLAIAVLFHALPAACKDSDTLLIDSDTLCEKYLGQWPEVLQTPLTPPDNGTACIDFPPNESICRDIGRTKMVSPVFSNTKLVESREKGLQSYFDKMEDWLKGSALLDMQTCEASFKTAACDVAFPQCAKIDSAAFSKCDSACRKAKDCVTDALKHYFPGVHDHHAQVLCKWALDFLNGCTGKC